MSPIMRQDIEVLLRIWESFGGPYADCAKDLRALLADYEEEPE